jgi:mono/diheme cytochrome c family protein
VFFSALLGAGVLGACGPVGVDSERVRQLVYLDQGERWTPRERAIYYYTPQGTELNGVRYSWFRSLERANSQEAFAAPENLSRFGFLYAPEQFNPGYDGGAYNPGNLPVGFTYHADERGGDALLDITCAACHTGELEYQGLHLRVDGGQAMHALAWLKPGQFVAELLLALGATYLNPLKFDRFAEKVLGPRYPRAKPELFAELSLVLDRFLTESLRARTLYKDDGYGRIDALGHIANTVFGDDLDPANQQVADAPVNYPHIWDIWKFDWVQYNGSVAQPMGRNVGEAIGVKARIGLVDDARKALVGDELYASSVLVRELNCIETTLWQLGPPRWPPVFPPIDEQRAEAGRQLFDVHCRGCHGPHRYAPAPVPQLGTPSDKYGCTLTPADLQPSPGKPIEWKVCVEPQWVIGTDSRLLDNFLDRRYDASSLDPSNPALSSISSGEALNIVTMKVIERAYDRLGLSQQQRETMNGWGRESMVREMRGYKARPLHGVWATPPFLHNGSVRTLYQLLSPQRERQSKFFVGSRQFDPVHIGYEDEPIAGAFELDTSVTGNHNTGHQFTNDGGAGVIGPELSPEQRLQIIEWLKVMGDPEADPNYADDYGAWAGPAECPRDLQGPASDPEARAP